MRILLDECLPKRPKSDLVGHEAMSVHELGWAGKTNGDLLTLAQVDYDVFLTVDRNLSFQQDINKVNIAVIVLVARSNKHAALQPLVTEVLSVITSLAPGQVIRVGT